MAEPISVREANALDHDGFVARFGTLFEGSPWIAERAWHDRPFDGLTDLFEALRSAMYDAPPERKLDLIRAHPDLAGKAAVEGSLTPESAQEQSSAGLDRLSPQEYELFNRLNNSYREKFGFPLVVCVREHTKESILAEAEARLEHSRSEEVEISLGEISRIAYLRLQDLVEPDPGEMTEDAETRTPQRGR